MEEVVLSEAHGTAPSVWDKTRPMFPTLAQLRGDSVEMFAGPKVCNSAEMFSAKLWELASCRTGVKRFEPGQRHGATKTAYGHGGSDGWPDLRDLEGENVKWSRKLLVASASLLDWMRAGAALFGLVSDCGCTSAGVASLGVSGKSTDSRKVTRRVE